MRKLKQGERKFQVMMRRTNIYLIFILLLSPALGWAQNEGTLRLVFTLEANGKPIQLRDSSYHNGFGENYTINKLKFYAGQWILGDHLIDEYLLVNAALEENKIDLSLQPGKYNQFSFLLGVDSIRNVSGAQDGPLDPMNDMFWTWNTGYIMFKLEGNSPQSTADLNRIEWHIGGFKGPLNVTRRIRFDAPFEIVKGAITEIQIKVDLDKIWKGKNEFKIANDPMCMVMGSLANKIADNFQGLFSIRNVSVPK